MFRTPYPRLGRHMKNRVIALQGPDQQVTVKNIALVLADIEFLQVRIMVAAEYSNLDLFIYQLPDNG